MANTSPSVKSKEDQGLSGHDEKENPFAEYMWMENEEDFNRQVEEELQEQDFLDRCFQEMLDEEDQDWFIPSRDLPQAMGQLQQQLNGLSVSEGHDSEDILSKSNLNPDAKEFIPGEKYWADKALRRTCLSPHLGIVMHKIVELKMGMGRARDAQREGEWWSHDTVTLSN